MNLYVMRLCRDSIHLVCTNLEIFRASQAKIEKQRLESMTLKERDIGLKAVLASENKLHPALFSAEAEHKVRNFCSSFSYDF